MSRDSELKKREKAYRDEARTLNRQAAYNASREKATGRPYGGNKESQRQFESYTKSVSGFRTKNADNIKNSNILTKKTAATLADRVRKSKPLKKK